MTESSQRVNVAEAVGYASSLNYLLLVAVIGLGWILWIGGSILLGSALGSPGSETGAFLFGILIGAGGLVATFIGVVATAYKLIVDTGIGSSP